MARVKISEYTAKTVLCKALGLPWDGLPITSSTTLETISKYFRNTPLVIKVDQGIKKRGKNGLIKVGITAKEALEFVRETKGYNQFLLEPVLYHSPSEEHYLSLERIREGIRVLYSKLGGMDVEAHMDKMEEYIVQSKFKNLDNNILKRVEQLVEIMNTNHISFLEINPLVVQGERTFILDAAVEVDDSSSTLQKIEERNVHPAEQAVAKLQANTPASLKLKIINPNGRIWMLLSGGGASLVLSDEVADRGHGNELANYGEYSGSPTTEDTYLYTKILLQTLLLSTASNKVLIIAGGVANFTDVVKTFKGVILALSEYAPALQKQNVKVYVRRGGPNQEKGLADMKAFLEKNKLLGCVFGPEKKVTDVIEVAIKSI